jgi:hypothetical protein
MPYTPESVDIPTLVVCHPSFDSSGGITAVPTHTNYQRRIKNDSDATDILIKDTPSKSFDLWDNVKQVTVSGIGTFTYRQVARLLAKITDIEHG